ncbi:MAG: hypothetical protein ACM31C_21215 [Acidobacteriota bacterium]
MKVVLSYLLAFGGLGLMLYVFAPIAGRAKYLEARATLWHLLRTMPNHAELRCKAATGTFGEAVAAAMKTAVMMKTRDPAMLQKGTLPAYDAQVIAIRLHWKAVLKKVRTAGMLAIGAIVLAASIHTSVILHVLLALVTIAAGVYVFLFKLDVDRSLMLARAEILPEVERAFAEGRYVLPPG